MKTSALVQSIVLSMFQTPSAPRSASASPKVDNGEEKSKKRYKCSHCSKIFFRKGCLDRHSQIHTQHRPYGPCQYCGKRFIQLPHLQQHLRTHTGERPYKCQFAGCNKAFTQMSSYKYHSRRHEFNKPHKCKRCYKSFETEILLSYHSETHDGHNAPYICDHCGKSYTSETYLHKHKIEHSENKTKNFASTGRYRTDIANDLSPYEDPTFAQLHPCRFADTFGMTTALPTDIGETSAGAVRNETRADQPSQKGCALTREESNIVNPWFPSVPTCLQ